MELDQQSRAKSRLEYVRLKYSPTRIDCRRGGRRPGWDYCKWRR